MFTKKSTDRQADKQISRQTDKQTDNQSISPSEKKNADKAVGKPDETHMSDRLERDGVTGEALRFIVVGILNTLLGTVLTFGFYNLAHMGYWAASGLSYVLASIFSFFMNKKFTFRNKDSLTKSGLRFAVNVAVCYFLAFGLAKPSVLLALSRYPWLPEKLTDNIALLAGMVLFTCFNFFGQKFFAFRKK